MKKFKQLILFYFVVLSAAIVLYGCCQGSLNIVGSGTASIFDDRIVEVDTIRNEIKIAISPETLISSISPSLGLVTSSYATSCDYEVENNVVASTVKLSCDRDFQLGSDLIVANTNYVSSQGVTVVVEDYSYSYVEITIDTSFMQMAEFGEELYTFKVEMETENGLQLTNEVSAYIRMD